MELRYTYDRYIFTYSSMYFRCSFQRLCYHRIYYLPKYQHFRIQSFIISRFLSSAINNTYEIYLRIYIIFQSRPLLIPMCVHINHTSNYQKIYSYVNNLSFFQFALFRCFAAVILDIDFTQNVLKYLHINIFTQKYTYNCVFIAKNVNIGRFKNRTIKRNDLRMWDIKIALRNTVKKK